MFNSKNRKKIITNVDYKLINDLNISEVPLNKFPIKKILKILPKKDSLFETVLVSVNDTLVDFILKKKFIFIKSIQIYIKF